MANDENQNPLFWNQPQLKSAEEKKKKIGIVSTSLPFVTDPDIA